MNHFVECGQGLYRREGLLQYTRSQPAHVPSGASNLEASTGTCARAASLDSRPKRLLAWPSSIECWTQDAGLRPPAENSRVDSMGKGEIRPSLDPCNNATIKTLFGKQSGADVSYYAHKPGRPSHALHTYFVSHLRMVLDVVGGDGWMDAKRGNGGGNGHKRNGALRHWRRAPGSEPNRRSHAD